MKLKFLTFLIVPLLVLVLFSFNKINPNNPPAGRTGAPGETTCQASGCHSGGNFSGTVEISGIPDTVIAEQTYTVTLTNTSDANRAGFQLTVLDNANKKVGTLTAGTGSSIANAGGRQYVRQSSPRTLTNGSTSWTFTWKAPTEVTNDSIFFYFATLCANGNGQITGDNALKNSKTALLPKIVSSVTENQEPFDFRFYPNPTNNFVSIEIPGKGSAKIMNENGQIVLASSVNFNHKMDISDLPSGLYFLKVELGEKVQTKLFVKN